MTIRSNRTIYNRLLRTIAVHHSAHFGVDTPEARVVQARMIRKIRRDYPYDRSTTYEEVKYA